MEEFLSMFRSIHTLLMFGGFIGICVWAYSGKRKRAFDEAANLPFADEEAYTVNRKGAHQ